MAPPLPYEEVVIDGDTSTDDDDDAVVVVNTPQSRKRRRQSTILDDEDEALASSQSQSTTVAAPSAPPPRGGPHAPMDAGDTEEIDDDDDDDDDVEIIQISTPASAEAKQRKTKRLSIMESDEEHDDDGTTQPTAARSVQNKLELEPVRRLAASATPQEGDRRRDAPASASASATSSTGRRSSRIEKKREEKGKAGPSVRKLEFLSLENCLDPPSRSRGDDDDDDEFIVNDDEEEAEATEEDEEEQPSRCAQKQKRRRTRSPPPRGFATADDEDLDEFIVGDDEVEYMDEDEEGVMDQPMSSADEIDEDEDGEDLRVTMQSREPSEWFAIYLRYLEECILDENLDNKIRTVRRKTEYRLFEQAAHHIERAICSRRDALRSSVVWDDAIMDNLHSATKFHSSRCTATTDCEACRRVNHYATQLAQFGGFACDSTELYKSNWIKKLRAAVRELEPVRASFELGTVCHARMLGFWQLLHAKHFWVALVDAKRRESGDGNGRIAEDERNAFYKAEYGRYKRLLNVVDGFSTDTTQSMTYMPNVWKKVDPHHVQSEFLPAGESRGSNGVRRGAMDSLVADSDDNGDGGSEEEDEEEEEEEELEEKVDPRQAQSEQGTSPARGRKEEEDEDADDVVDVKTRPTPRKTMRQCTLFSAMKTPGSSRTSSPSAPKTQSPTANGSATAGKPMKPLNEVEAEDLVCLVCRQNQRDGAVAHGNYLHFYSCYRCAKRQHAAKQGCMVCDRPIDNVLRILPLSKESRADILKQQEAT